MRSGTLRFDGRATVGDFTGVTAAVQGRMTGGSLEEVTGWVVAQVDSLTTDNDRRDRDLRKSMETDKFPTMRFDLSGVEVESRVADSAVVTLVGRFTIHGVERAQRLPARLYFDDGAVRVTGSFPMNLHDYRIGGLSKMLGILKMHPDIMVHVDLVFAPAAEATAPPEAGRGARRSTRE